MWGGILHWSVFPLDVPASAGPDKLHCTVLRTAQNMQKYYLKILRSTRRLTKGVFRELWERAELKSDSSLYFSFFHQLRVINKHLVFKCLEDNYKKNDIMSWFVEKLHPKSNTFLLQSLRFCGYGRSSGNLVSWLIGWISFPHFNSLISEWRHDLGKAV